MLACIDMGKGGLRTMGKRAREKVLREFDARQASEAYLSVMNETLKGKSYARSG